MVPKSFTVIYYPNSGELLDILLKGFLLIIRGYVECRVWGINHNNEQVNAKGMWELGFMQVFIDVSGSGLNTSQHHLEVYLRNTQH